MKGIEAIRRDNCLLASMTVTKVIDILLVEKNVDKAKTYTKGIISDLLNNKIDLSQMIITKSISRTEQDYKSK